MRIVSAGKTSAERAALSIARKLGLPIEGRCPKNQDYLTAIQRNLRACDGTLELSWSRPPRCRLPAMQTILRSAKPSMGVAVRHRQNIAATRDFIHRHKIKALHVTGNIPFTQAKEFLQAVLKDEAGV